MSFSAPRVTGAVLTAAPRRAGRLLRRRTADAATATATAATGTAAASAQRGLTASARTRRTSAVAALRIVMPPGRLADGILLVSMTGSPLTGSGKSLTPCARTHAANLSVLDCCAGVRLALSVPGGCQALQALTALVQTAPLTLMP